MGSASLPPADNSLARVVDEEEAQLVEKLRALLQEEEDLVCPLNDIYLLRYLRYRKHDVDRALKSVTTAWKDRHRIPVLHDGISPSNFEHYYRRNVTTTFKYRDHLGRQCVIWNVGRWDPTETPLLEMFKSTFCQVDTISERQETQLKGTVYILDLSGLGMTHVQACTMTAVRTLLGVVDGYPMKIKGIHFINHPAIFNAVWMVVKMFMKAKMKKRVQFHGYDHTSLHKWVKPNILPKSYGGELEDDEFAEPNFFETMLAKEEYYKDIFDINKYGYLVKDKNQKL